MTGTGGKTMSDRRDRLYADLLADVEAFVFDDKVAAVGTANFDNRSFRLNFEITALIVDHEFNKEVEQMFLDDFSNSSTMEDGSYDTKTFWLKLAVRLANLTSPML